MIELRIHHRTTEEQDAMRNDLSSALAGWKPFIDYEVAVCGPVALDPEPITRLVVGPTPDKRDESVAILDVKAEDLKCCISRYLLPEGYPIPKMYDVNYEYVASQIGSTIAGIYNQLDRLTEQLQLDPDHIGHLAAELKRKEAESDD